MVAPARPGGVPSRFTAVRLVLWLSAAGLLALAGSVVGAIGAAGAAVVLRRRGGLS